MGLIAFLTFTIICGCFVDIVSGDDCSCDGTGGCNTTNKCWPESGNCMMENVALGKRAEMSSTYRSGNTESGPACLAVNGDRSHVLVLKTGQSTDRLNCIHTDYRVTYARWSVDLGAEYTVTGVTIYNRDIHLDSLRNAALTVDDQLCEIVTDSNNWLVLNVTCRQPVRGQNVTLRTTTTSEKRFFNFCELEVWVCSAGRYGATCGQQCSSRCSNGACDNYNGTCLQGCQKGFYGDFCDQTCVHCKNNITCDQKSVNCVSGCEVGWQPPLCTEPCSPGSYGENCLQKCGECKGGNTKCDIYTGECESGCQPGYQSTYCNQSCSRGFYGDGCTNKCGKCTKPPCHHVTGVCTGGCDKGYQGQLCNEVCSPGSYGADCKQSCGQCKGGNTECNTTSGVCESGCQPGYVAAYCNQRDDCSCDANGGCDTTNKCWPNSNNCRMENVALGKRAEMSSTYRSGKIESGPACLAVNGNRSHVLVMTGQSTDRLNCIHTDENVKYARWSVDLGAEYTVTRVTIYNRNYNLDSLSNAMLSVDDKLCQNITNSNNLVFNVTCQQPVRGRNVTLRTTTKSGKKFFNFCELEVWVCSAGRYGATCGQQCSSGCSNGACDNYNGTCLQGCKAGFYGDLCNQTCGRCTNNAACDQKTGNCPECEEGWKPPLCAERDPCWYNTTNKCWPDSSNCVMENVALGKPAEMSSTYRSGNQQSGPACLAVNGNRSHVLVLKTGQSTDRLNCIHTDTDSRDSYVRWLVDLGAEYTVTRVTIYNRDTNQDSLRNALLYVDHHYCTTITDSDNWLVLNVTCQPPVRGRNVTLYTSTDNRDKRFFNFCELEVWVCSAGRYGPTCGQRCSSLCSNGTCDNYFGTCLQGCQEGFYGHFCDKRCGHCKNNIACYQSTGNCLSVCDDGWQPPLCTKPCSPGSYGENCRKKCGQCKGGNTKCDIYTGECKAGCQPGYQSTHCDLTCSSGSYGDGCTNKCGKCAKPPCSHVTGVCTGGCDKGYQGQLCNEVCSPGSYGADCKQSCGQCKGGNTECNTTSGVCESGCQPGYVAAYCNQTCNRGFYGDACSHWCGYCRQGDCEHVNGVCPGGCVAGYAPPLCNKICDQGLYGDNCRYTCGNCSHGDNCEPVTGVCPGGCLAGYQPPLCNETCSNGYHGINCSYTCGNCSQTGKCSPVDGACSSGCQGGYEPPYCNTTCGRGFHGDNCAQTCGFCAVDTCHHETGVCSSGCQSGYHGDLCKQERGGGSAGRVGGAVAGVIILVLIGVVVFFVVRNKRRKERKSDMALHHHTNTNREENDYQPMAEAALNSSPSIPPIKPRSSPKPPHSHNSSAATQPTGDNLYMNVPEHTVTAMPTPSSSNSLGNDFGDERGDDDDDDDDVYTNDSLYATFRASSPQLDRVQRALVDRLASDQLPEEFKELLKGLTDDHKVAKLNSNIKKNRYASVLPYDYNRVILNDGFRKAQLLTTSTPVTSQASDKRRNTLRHRVPVPILLRTSGEWCGKRT
ncbi:cell death abnormality protein 1-like isoform X2 [Pomacea canaliculata]|uniref:cell death abnormality protein 1-like isoform X2 n=1 Tax=Pomacea canaliculata TaxID=400727 RepID=UPI000D7290DD|nr:cell death abnormality protein 1-like isoform X2 [Pomacea canaliculata]